MHFQQPELLYALILLIIPLIIHLFRLRKFQKEDFTNVKFLKKVIQETRKSSRLKKFLLLITRLLLLTCLILAFAKPFIPASKKALTESQTLIYLDNSFSMQAGNVQSTNFSKAINPLLESMEGENQYSLFTNSDDYFDRSLANLKDELQNIDHSENQISFREIILKAENYFQKYPTAEKDLLIISDFQSRINIPSELNNENISYHLVQPKPQEINNASLDSAYINEITPESITLNILASSNKNLEEPISISIYDGETLLGRNTINFEDENSATVNFRLQNTLIANGRIEIEDSGLKYDNTLYFNINENPGIKVVIVSALESDFLKRIYNKPEFETNISIPNQIDFNQLNSANLVILNEIDQLSPSLTNNLSQVNQNGATLIIIPPIDAQDYGPVLNSFGFSAFSQKADTEKLITNISFDHPLLENVFEDRIDNFEYPKVLSSYDISSSNAILSYQDNRPFLAESNSVYLFTAALNNQNSNFKNSPLIVPVFYQIGLKALKKNQLFYFSNNENEIDVPVDLGNDQVIHLVNGDTDIIPQQQNFSKRVEISTGNVELDAGNYEITNNDRVIGNLSFNDSREESQLEFSDISKLESVNIYSSVGEYFSESNAATQITTLWKWFVIFALIFLAVELLLIKFLK